jgi:hypothetical protein
MAQFAPVCVSEQTGMANIDSSQPDKTIDEFCKNHRISRWSYYAMRKAGTGPVELVIPGTAIIRISAQSEMQWQLRMAELSKTKKAKLTVARRIEQAKQAGAMAAQSAKHISRRRPGSRRLWRR